MTNFIPHAVVIGATGLVGKHLIAELNQMKSCEKITAIVRRFNQDLVQYDKVQQIVCEDFTQLHFEQVETCCHAFSCLGTTIKKAGSKTAFYQSDYSVNAHFASLFVNTAVHYLLVSAMAADAHSVFYYNRVKGELENYIRQLGLAKVSIIQPSLLLGERQEQRWAEQAAQRLFTQFAKILPQKFAYRPVTAEQVAQTLTGAAERQIEKFVIYDNLAVQNNFQG